MSGGRRQPASGPVRTLVVHCEDWPLVAAGVAPTTPAVVLAANRVVATNAAARAEGIRVGHRRREAQARSPQVEVRAEDPAGEARAFEVVAAAVEAVTPRLELTRPGVASFLTRGPSRYFGGDRALVERVVALVAEVTPAVGRVGVADGPFAALRAARSGVVVEPGASRAFLAPLPVTTLHEATAAVEARPTAEMVDVLVRLGVTTLGDLAALPRPDLVARFGRVGERAHRLASGEDDRLPDLRPPPPSWSPSSSWTRRPSASTPWPSPPSAWPTTSTAASGPAAWPVPRWWSPPRPTTVSATSGTGVTRGRCGPRPWPNGCAGSSRAG